MASKITKEQARSIIIQEAINRIRKLEAALLPAPEPIEPPFHILKL
jgi:hypothetical protein